MNDPIRDGNLRQASVYIRTILNAPYPAGDEAGQDRALLAGQALTAIERLDAALSADRRHVSWIWSPPGPSPPIFNKRIYGLLHQILALLQSSGLAEVSAKLDNMKGDIMAVLDDLKTAYTNLTAEVADLGAKMDVLFKAYQDAHAAGDPVAIQAATDAINATTATLKEIGTRDVPA